MASATESVPREAAAAIEPPAISLRGLRRDFGELAVFRDVSIEVEAGSTLAVLGPNGAGKSTLLRILATLLRPTSGAVTVLGAELPGQAWKARGRIGYLGHEPLLYRELSVRENLAFNARLHSIESPGARIDGLLAGVGLARRGDELVRNLSAGLLQRAAICRALLAEPELLLLDEPRSHLDIDAAGEIESMIGPAPGRTRVLVTHDVEHGLEQGDRVLALRADGTVAHAGAASALSLDEARAIYGGRL